MDAEAFGKMAAQYWLGFLSAGNAYVEKHGGWILGREFLKMNELAMAHLATKYALETGAKPEDMAAGTVVISGAVVGGQSAFYAYQDYRASQKRNVIDAKPGDERAVNINTGKPAPLASVPANGAPSGPGTKPAAGPGGRGTIPDQYG